MIFKTICLLLLFVRIHAQVKDYYTGAVVEYYTKYDETTSPGNNIQRNIDEYLKIIEDAKAKGADIIVFPEYGLTTTTHIESNIQLFTTILPDPENKTVVCNSTENWSKVIERLSCAAKNNSIYVVVNLPERVTNNSTEKIYYNTNIVFDRTGALIARYRQFNVVDSMFNKTQTPDLTTFETDFGVTFGTFTTFDIMFSQPSLELLRKNNKVTDIIYTTSWESELPFLTSVQMQAGWARANGVNLLAASNCEPEKYHGGSGIYQTNGNIYTSIPVQKENSILIRNISKITGRKSLETIKNTTAKVETFKTTTASLQLFTHKENITKYKTEPLTESVTDHKLCHNDLCCTFTIEFTPQIHKDYIYRMAVYDGPRMLKSSQYHIQVCGIVACVTDKDESCGQRNPNPTNPLEFKEITIKSSTFLDQGNTVIIPTNVRYDLNVLSPSNFTYSAVHSECYRVIEMKTTTSVKEMLGFGVYSLTLDTASTPGGLSGAVIAIIVIAVLVVLASIGLFIWKRFKTGSYKHPGGN